MPKKLVVLVDNRDSFTYNIVHALYKEGACVHVVRAGLSSLEECLALAPTHIVIGPGPGHPREALLSLDLIKNTPVPLLGICLGHQCLAEAFGAAVSPAAKPWHGKSCLITHTETSLFQGLPPRLKVGRYHSLLVHALPDDFTLLAQTEDNEIMAMSHASKPLYGVQFHPESILSEHGQFILKNFLENSHVKIFTCPRTSIGLNGRANALAYQA